MGATPVRARTSVKGCPVLEIHHLWGRRVLYIQGPQIGVDLVIKGLRLTEAAVPSGSGDHLPLAIRGLSSPRTMCPMSQRDQPCAWRCHDSRRQVRKARYYISFKKFRTCLPFSEALEAAHVKFTCLELFDSTTDLNDRLNYYENLMICHKYNDITRCFLFVSTFKSYAQTWFSSPPPTKSLVGKV